MNRFKVLCSRLLMATFGLMLSGMMMTTQAHGQIKPIWIDVRTQAEYDQGHLAEAVLIPYDKISSQIATVANNKNQPINLYCRSGRRAEIALHTLEQLGYTNIQNLGSYDYLIKAGQ